jgi:hypothetical protein
MTKLPDFAKEKGMKLPVRNQILAVIHMYERYSVTFLHPVMLWCFRGPRCVRKAAILVFFEKNGKIYYRSPHSKIGYVLEYFWHDICTIDNMQADRIYQQTHSIEYVEDQNLDNPMAQCPVCKHYGRLYDGFSLLASGFNGITSGSPDDVNMQECGHCGARLKW